MAPAWVLDQAPELRRGISTTTRGDFTLPSTGLQDELVRDASGWLRGDQLSACILSLCSPTDGTRRNWVGLNPIEGKVVVRTTKQLSITLPTEMAAALTDRVASGAYASESEVIRDGLRTLFARDQAVEAWLRSEVLASVEELRADGTRAIEREDVRAELARWHTERATDD